MKSGLRCTLAAQHFRKSCHLYKVPKCGHRGLALGQQFFEKFGRSLKREGSSCATLRAAASGQLSFLCAEEQGLFNQKGKEQCRMPGREKPDRKFVDQKQVLSLLWDGQEESQEYYGHPFHNKEVFKNIVFCFFKDRYHLMPLKNMRQKQKKRAVEECHQKNRPVFPPTIRISTKSTR